MHEPCHSGPTSIGSPWDCDCMWQSFVIGEDFCPRTEMTSTHTDGFHLTSTLLAIVLFLLSTRSSRTWASLRVVLLNASVRQGIEYDVNQSIYTMYICSGHPPLWMIGRYMWQSTLQPYELQHTLCMHSLAMYQLRLLRAGAQCGMKAYTDISACPVNFAFIRSQSHTPSIAFAFSEGLHMGLSTGRSTHKGVLGTLPLTHVQRYRCWLPELNMIYIQQNTTSIKHIAHTQAVLTSKVTA